MSKISLVEVDAKLTALEAAGTVKGTKGEILYNESGTLVSKPLAQEIATLDATGLSPGLFYYLPDGTLYYLTTGGTFI